MTQTVAELPFTIIDGPQRRAKYAELAAAAPVHRVALPTGEPAWLITGYHEVRRALNDPRLIKSDLALASFGRDVVPPKLFAAMTSHMLNRNPPDHTRLRRLVSTVFTRRRIEQLAPRIQQITDELLDGIDTAAQADLIGSFALPLPVTVVCELLGVPESHRTQFHDWTSTFVTGMLAGPSAIAAAAAAMIDYLQELLHAKRTASADDLLSALVAARDGQDRLSEDELTSMAALLLIAGHETTVNLIGNGLLALLTHPDQMALLRAQPHRLDAAVEELLRFDGPLQVATFRLSTEPVNIGEVTIPAGEIVIASVLAANQDHACTRQPDALDITRIGNPHVAFGHGIHHCLGAPLARLEGRIALGTVLTRFPGLRLAVAAEQLTRPPGVLMNGLKALPVLLR